jgi:O-antigen/teichoic acid export membrane protein
MTPSTLGSLARNSGFLVGAQSIAGLARAGYAVLLATWLGPELYGWLNYGMAWYLMFVPLGTLGLAAIVGREVGRDAASGATIVGRSASLRLLATTCTAVLCLAVGWLTEASADTRLLLLIFSFAVVGRGLATWANGVFVAYESTQHTLRHEVTFRLGEVALGTAALLLGGSVFAVACVHTAVWWLQGAVALLVIRRHVVAVRADWNPAAMLALLATAVPLGVCDILHTWLLQGPLLLFRRVNGIDGTLGEFALAMQAFFTLGAVARAVGVAGLPVLSRAAARGDGADRRLVESLLRAGLLFGAVAGLLGLALGPSVALVFGPGYARTGALLGLSLWLITPMSCAITLSNALFTRGEIKPQVVAGAVAACALALAMWPLARLAGPSGAVAAAGLGFATWAACLVPALHRVCGMDVGQAIGRPAAVAAMSAGVYLSLRPLGDVVALVPGLLVLASGVVLGVLAPHERRALGLALRTRLP